MLFGSTGDFSQRNADIGRVSLGKDNHNSPRDWMLKQARKENACKQAMDAFMLLR